MKADAKQTQKEGTRAGKVTRGEFGTSKKKDAVRTPWSATSTPVVRPDVEPNLDDPKFFLNRELTWLNFTFRVLQEARDPRTPLLERLKFLSIVGSNLDEFFMKRIGGLKQQAGAGIEALTVDGRTPEQQIEECQALVRVLLKQQRRAFLELLVELDKHKIRVLPYSKLDKKDKAYLRDYYLENIYPLVTPQATDPAHPFPFISNQSLNLLVTLRYKDEPVPSLARVKVPVGAGISRFLQLENRNTFVPLEDVMAGNLDLLFPGMQVESCELFRATRNANTEQEEDKADDLLAIIETELRERKFAPIVRLEVAQGMSAVHCGMLASELGLDEGKDVFDVEGVMAMADLMEITRVQGTAFHDPAHHPADHPGFATDRNIFHVVRDNRSFLLHHPYDSYVTSVERFLREASRDPKVLAIKMSLYRTSAESKVIQYLSEAARNGKQVAVVVELKAKFDEAANIRWANRLGAMGIHVTYGVVGLKTHCKLILVVRRDYSGLRRYAHIGTGNYHAVTARLYSDLGLITCDDEIGQDLTELFNYLSTGYKPRRRYKKILIAPKVLKQELLDKIQREIDGHTSKEPGLIQFKLNALEDAEVTRALYRAAGAGVRVDLIVRDTCRLRPGIPGLSESVRVISVIGRFLEHARLYYFRNGGSEEYFIGSADCMKRNLDSRVEVVVPVVDSELRSELRVLLDTQLADRRGSWEMQTDGSYVQLQPTDEATQRHSQTALIERADKRLKQATRFKRRKPRGISPAKRR